MNSVNVKRIVAFVIDLLFIATLINIGFSLLYENYSPTSFNFGWFPPFVLPGVFLGGYLLYFFLFDLIFEGQTLGKLASSILVVGSSNNHILDFKKRFIRSLLKMLSILLLPLSILLFFSWGGFTIHEKVSDSKTILN